MNYEGIRITISLKGTVKQFPGMYIAWTMDQVIGTWFATTKLRSLLVRDTN